MTKIKKYMSVFIMALILDSFLTACSILKKKTGTRKTIFFNSVGNAIKQFVS